MWHERSLSCTAQRSDRYCTTGSGSEKNTRLIKRSFSASQGARTTRRSDPIPGHERARVRESIDPADGGERRGRFWWEEMMKGRKRRRTAMEWMMIKSLPLHSAHSFFLLFTPRLWLSLITHHLLPEPCAATAAVAFLFSFLPPNLSYQVLLFFTAIPELPNVSLFFPWNEIE